MRNPAAGDASLPLGSFRRLGLRGWSNLALAATWALLVLYTVVSIASRGLLEYWGADYRAFRSAGEIATREGLAAVYDVPTLEAPQRELFDAYAAPAMASVFEVIPVPYLPVFVAPLSLLPLLDPIVGWLLWTGLNGVLMVIGLAILARHLGLEWSPRTVAFFLASLPAFLTLAFGQVNGLLMVGVSGFVIRARRRDDLLAGIWLSALLIKPQLLLLAVPGLILVRRWRSLAGLLVSTVAVMALSWALVGTQGMASLVRLWLGYTGSMPTTYPESMMNLRAVMIALSPYLGSLGVTLSALAAGAAVAALGIVGWTRAHARRLPDAVLSLYSASSVIAWHAHVHLALPLEGLLLARPQPDALRHRVELATVIVPSAVFAIVGLLVDAGAAHLFAGMAFFLINLAVLAWSLRQPDGPTAGFVAEA